MPDCCRILIHSTYHSIHVGECEATSKLFTTLAFGVVKSEVVLHASTRVLSIHHLETIINNDSATLLLSEVNKRVL